MPIWKENTVNIFICLQVLYAFKHHYQSNRDLMFLYKILSYTFCTGHLSLFNHITQCVVNDVFLKESLEMDFFKRLLVLLSATNYSLTNDLVQKIVSKPEKLRFASGDYLGYSIAINCAFGDFRRARDKFAVSNKRGNFIVLLNAMSYTISHEYLFNTKCIQLCMTE